MPASSIRSIRRSTVTKSSRMPRGGAGSSRGTGKRMMRTVQLSVADAGYRAALREALSRSGPWQVDSVEHPDPTVACVLVVDEAAFARLTLPLVNPERVVLIARQDPQALAEAWEAGIVSVVSVDDPLPTVLLAIMAATLRVATTHAPSIPSGFSPNPHVVTAPISPESQSFRSRRCKIR